MEKETKIKTKKKGKGLIAILWLSVLGGLGAIALLFFLSSIGVFGPMPDVKDLENPDIYVASEIISFDGKILDRYEREKRIPVEFDSLPPHLVNALQAKEDIRFTEHAGIDFKRTFGAFVKLGANGGGSTITQQLAKLLFTEDAQTGNIITRVFQKIKEMIIAVRLEKLYTKDEIITMYLNKFNFLYGANGIQTASKVYFNKNVSQLDLGQAATFVAMLQKPAGYNPRINPNDAIKGRDGVLNQMRKYKFITLAEENEIKGKPIILDYHPVRNVGETYSAYYKQELKKQVDSYLEDYEKTQKKKYDVYKDGLKIQVTLDSRMQTYAEEAMREHLSTVLQPEYNRQVRYGKYPYTARMSQDFYDKLMNRSIRSTGRYKNLKKEGKSEEEIMKDFNTPTRLDIFTWKEGIVDTLMTPLDSIKYHKTIVQSSFMAMEPHTGYIKAWVGGIDWNFFKYDLVKQGKRQVGSTFKPFVYAAAIIELGYTPCSRISNASFNVGGWRVKGGGGEVTLRDGLAKSLNPVAARLIASLRPDKVISMAKELGVFSPIKRDLTIALGSGEITLWEMVGAYSTFANNGYYIKPEMIWRIEDSKGKVIKENTPEIREVMNELYAYTMIDIMQGVTTYGTAKAMRGMGIKGQVAGKTGTTNDNVDGWFIGITPRLAAGAWVGWEQKYSRLQGGADGSRLAMPIWVRFFKKVYANPSLGYSQEDKFEEPDEVKAGGWDCESLLGLLSNGSEGLIDIYGATQPEEPVNNGSTNINRGPKDQGVNSKLNSDTLQDIFNN